jgi:Fe-S cluster biosynthesis and repair protein YggX
MFFLGFTRPNSLKRSLSCPTFNKEIMSQKFSADNNQLDEAQFKKLLRNFFEKQNKQQMQQNQEERNMSNITDEALEIRDSNDFASKRAAVASVLSAVIQTAVSNNMATASLNAHKPKTKETKETKQNTYEEENLKGIKFQEKLNEKKIVIDDYRKRLSYIYNCFKVN